MKRPKVPMSLLVIPLFLVAGWPSDVSRAASLQTLLRRFRATTMPWTRCAAEASISRQTTLSTRPGKIELTFTSVALKINGDAYDITDSTSDRWQALGDNWRPSANDPGRKISREIWDGGRYYRAVEDPLDGLFRVSLSSPTVAPRDLNAIILHNRLIALPNALPLGILAGDDVSLDNIIEQSPATTVECSDVSLENGTDCTEINAKTSYGKIQLWFESEHGCLIKAAIQKIKGDKYGNDFFGAPRDPIAAQALIANHLPSSAEKEMWVEMKNARIANISGVWLVAEADCARSETFAGGESERQVMHCRCVGADFNPDFKAHPIVPDFKEGSQVQIEEDTSTIPLRWHNGKPEPAIDEDLRKKLDQEIDDAMKEKPR